MLGYQQSIPSTLLARVRESVGKWIILLLYPLAAALRHGAVALECSEVGMIHYDTRQDGWKSHGFPSRKRHYREEQTDILGRGSSISRKQHTPERSMGKAGDRIQSRRAPLPENPPIPNIGERAHHHIKLHSTHTRVETASSLSLQRRA